VDPDLRIHPRPERKIGWLKRDQQGLGGVPLLHHGDGRDRRHFSAHDLTLQGKDLHLGLLPDPDATDIRLAHVARP